MENENRELRKKMVNKIELKIELKINFVRQLRSQIDVFVINVIFGVFNFESEFFFFKNCPPV